MIATLWEVWSDRHGDLNKGADVLIRVCLVLAEALAIHFIFVKPVVDCVLLSSAIFFMFFDYVIAYVLRKNQVIELPNSYAYSGFWFRYTAKKGFFDNIPLWKKAGPWLKFSVKLVVLITAIVIWII